MFRRRWSGLPEDPDFPIDLEKLGYFIQPETDEIRSIANPNFYFHYFRNKNERHNDRQRFAFNQAVQEIIHGRLENLGLVKVSLPSLPSASPSNGRDGNDDQLQRHVPIFISKDLHKADRVVVLFGEGLQQLGVLAHRVIGGQGGVDEGSVVSLVKAILKTDAGVVLANTGERWWWPEGQKPLCHRDSLGVKMKSCVHKVGSFDPTVNQIPGNEDVAAHVRSVFERVLGNAKKDGEDEGFVDSSTRIQVIAVGEAAPAVETYLDEDWGRWNDKIDCLAMLGDGKPVYELKHGGFKTFLRERARIYITTQAPLNTPLSNPEGNPNTLNFTSYGCPVLSSGEPYYVELTLIKAKDAVLAFLDDIYKAGYDVDVCTFVNPIFEITYAEEDAPEETPGWVVSEPNSASLQQE